MSKFQKDQPKKIVSHYEESWTASDYQEHEHEFKNMLIEYRNIKKQCGDSALRAQTEWLKQKGAIIIKDGDIFVKENYGMYTSMFDKFCQWLSFQEKRDKVELPSLQSLIGKTANLVDAFKIPKTIRDEANEDIIKQAVAAF